MKILISVLSFLTASVALANPFDSFVGNYAIVGTPAIQKSGDVKECIRFGFEYLTGFSVIADTNGYHQSHMLHFNFSGGTIGHGWSGHPVSDYRDQIDHNALNYAATTGDANLAQNEYFSAWSPTVNEADSEQLVVSIQRQGSQYLLSVKDNYKWGADTGTCSYQATLVKQ